MEAALSSGATILIYQATVRHFPEYSSLHSHLRENLQMKLEVILSQTASPLLIFLCVLCATCIKLTHCGATCQSAYFFSKATSEVNSFAV